MNSRYILIKDCLDALRQCDMPAISKLRLEVQLFQIKLLLLRDDVRREIRRAACSEAALQKIQQQLARLNSCEVRDASLEAVGRDLQQIALNLEEAVTKAHAAIGRS